MTRLIVYGISTKQTTLPESIFHDLESMRSHCDKLITALTPSARPNGESRNRLKAACDAVIDADAGSTFALLRRLLETYSLADLRAYDEITLLNDSLLGPLDRTSQFPTLRESSEIDAWGLIEPDASPGSESILVPWFTVRGSTMDSGSFVDALRAGGSKELPKVCHSAGLRVDYIHRRQSDREVFMVRDSLNRHLDDGLAFIPWRALTLDPLVCDRWAITPREFYDTAVARGYPASALWSYLLVSSEPRIWYTNLAMAEILPTCHSDSFTTTLTTAVLLHIYYVDMTTELLDYAANIPGSTRVFITTATEEKRAEILSFLEREDRFDHVEVRVVTTNRGRDISAFAIDCADVLRDSSIDLVVKLHSKRSVQDPESVSSWFRRHLFDNLLCSKSYARNVLQLFEEEPLLGMVFPPTIHMGLPTMGHSWGANLESARQLAARVAVTNKFDATTPLSPYGSMFIARRAALQSLVQANFDPEEFPSAEDYHDGSIAHVLERLISYMVISRGYYVKTVSTPRLAAIREPVLEYKTQAVGQYMQPHTLMQVDSFQGVGETWPFQAVVYRKIRRKLESKAPFMLNVLSRGARTARSIRRRRK